MLDTNTIIKCPDCQKDIRINTLGLLAGTSYFCGTCQLSVGLSNDSKPVVSNALNELEKIKSKK